MTLPKSQFKESHINKDRRYEVDEIAANCKGKPSTIIPKKYWDDLKARTKEIKK